MMLRLLVTSLLLLKADCQNVCPYTECDCYYSGRQWVTDCRARGLDSLPALAPAIVSGNATLDPSGYNTLLLGNNNITDIPCAALPANLHTIIASNNPVRAIQDCAFHESGDTLTFLDLTGSDLTTLPDAFMELQNLTSLYWADNSILTWGNDTVLAHLAQSLKRLSLYNTSLTSVPAWLGRFPLLQHLDLGMNDIHDIPPVITNMTSLLTLDLSHNNLSTVDLGSLPVSLQDVRLRDNNMAAISDDVTRLVNLVNLDLSLNHIKSLDTLTFPSRLTELLLSHNDIDYVYNLDFTRNVSSLQTLFLDDNPLKVIHTDAFTQVPGLDRLVASQTLLSRLPIALSDLDQLAVLEMNTIPTLSCTCAEKPLASWFNVTSVTIFGQCHAGDISYFLGTLAPTCP